MAGVSKIVRYGLEPLTLDLFGQGKSERDIARALTEHLCAEGHDDEVSQSAVNRWLATYRELRSTKAAAQLEEYADKEIRGDLDRLTQMKDDAFSLRSQSFALLAGQAARHPSSKSRVSGSVKEYLSLDAHLHNLIRTTLGLGGGDADPVDFDAPVDLSKFRKGTPESPAKAAGGGEQ